ncbi:alpha/beta hydrolase [Pseudomonas sp. 5P_3.1_Bac2]|uniref:alpha/beta hydrolase n=1 Tax=Pseudomonas sp. 5P_3.1_Bac2 TaxID=2971617 RepID=UPI0021C68D3E|nr:alpha/beta hydrolase [Pseudomonas sp. 5P_3.1_Bac2]MCU1716948.1 alpha/beta hydrolase [Pseudomonas sp. 5P_3.1_Bac2]
MTQGFTEVRLPLEHIELAARVYGPEDGKPVLALHGWLDNAASFARLAPLLPGLRIVALDMAGHGLSAHRPVGASYAIWDYAHDVLQVAEYLGWSRFAVLGHSMGAISAVLLAAAMPERVERLALIDGLIPFTGEADTAAAKLGEALRAQLALSAKSKPLYSEVERAVLARMRGTSGVSREAAQLLVQRGLEAVEGGYTWSSDSRLTLPSAMRLTQAHARGFVESLQCPVRLVLAEQGMASRQAHLLPWLDSLPIEQVRLPGGHHLHLDDAAGAALVADCFKAFLLAS